MTAGVGHSGCMGGSSLEPRLDVEAGGLFPMFTVSVAVVLALSYVKRHEELLSTGDLVEFCDSLGHAMFVSHQWMSAKHPDPDFNQFRVLQDALRNLLSGRSKVRQSVATEAARGRVKTPTAADINAEPLYLWYDYFCCPQMDSIGAVHARRRAIDCIASYVCRCKFFVVLCPVLKHCDHDCQLDHRSWASRGWCRSERMARELSLRNHGHIIVIHGAHHQRSMFSSNSHLEAPGMGEFTEESDRPRISRIILRMLWDKLLHLLQEGDLLGYRFLLNTQAACYLKGLDTSPIEALMLGLSRRR